MLNQQLLLVQFLLTEFGFRDFADLRKGFSHLELRADETDASLIAQNLVTRSGLKVPTQLRQYDDNLMAHLAAMNRARAKPISLKYYQYFSALFTEYYLDHYFADQTELLARLNRFRAQSTQTAIRRLPELQESDLNKLAFWNATGSGKTFLLHLNILQFRHYARQYHVKVKNLILLTPSEELSAQHLAELTQSSIAAAPYADDKDGPGLKVIELSKIKLDKQGSGGVTVPVGEFEEQNALFVDEGHKGSKTEDSVWRDVRNRISRQGFAFEYSATFGQITDPALLNEYARCIAFDYSYGRFYADGYGKSYWIHNLTDHELTDELTKRQYLLQNLLLFVQQKRHFHAHPDWMGEYQLENPLLVFVGSSVTPKAAASVLDKKETEEVVSDVKTVLDFFRDFATNRERYLAWIEQLGRGQGLFPADYRGRLAYLFAECPSAEEIYALAIRRVFNAPSAEPLELYTLRNNNAEIALKLRGSEHYFGLIYIGDVGTFKASLGEGYEVKRDVVVAQSLFGSLADQSSNPINLLIGARKFIEGWNNFRVSSIGLINFGRAKGAQIIQLFGRGVRLRGKDGSLQRSQSEPDAPATLHVNETLNIFGLRADYMRRFNEDLHKEGIRSEVKTYEFPAKLTHDLSQLQLLTLQRKDGIPAFQTTPVFALTTDDTLPPIRLDVASKRFSATGAEAGQSEKTGVTFSLHALAGWIDWDVLHQHLQQTRRDKHFTNLVIRRDALPGLFGQLRHQVVADEALSLRSLADVERLQKLAFQVMKRYLESFYKRRLRAYEGEHLHTVPLDETNANLSDLTWRVEITTTDAAGNALTGIGYTLQLLDNLLKTPYPQNWESSATLQHSWAQSHLYQPLLSDEERQKTLMANGTAVVERITPPGLNKGETRFVEHLKTFVANKATWGYADHEFFLLRNLSRGRGFGFYFEASGGFYPDFLLWIKEPGSGRQYLTFIDPHGLRNEDRAWQSDKIQLHRKLKSLQAELGDELKLNSFILDPNGDLKAAGLDRWERPAANPVETLVEFAARQHVYEIPVAGNAAGKGGYIQEIVAKILEDVEAGEAMPN